jgi:hypothetical protein
MDPHGQRQSWYVYKYFDGTYETDLQRFPTWDTVRAWMASAGIEPISVHQVEKYENTYPGEAVLQDHFIQKHSCSQLALLSDEAYAAGLDRISQEIETAEEEGEVYQFHSVVTLDMVTGRKH